MIVKIHLQTSSDPIPYENAKYCFQKGDFFCVTFTDNEGMTWTDKYPIANIHQVRNGYPPKDYGNV